MKYFLFRFVRCLDTTTSESLDTSMSARSYQCCLVWQHPSLPWLQLFPRLNVKSTSNVPNLVVTHPSAVKALHSDWVESFRSLFQLLRAKQCPYFYFCANTFTILFRAAGICGFSDIHAVITPTTRGFRQALKQEGKASIYYIIHYFFTVYNIKQLVWLVPELPPKIICIVVFHFFHPYIFVL